MEPTDGELVARCQAGEQRAWEELVSRHDRRLWGVARYWGLDATSAENVVQSTWYNLLLTLRRDGLRDMESVGAWLATAVRREAVRVSKRERRGEPEIGLPPDLPSVDQRLLEAERVQALRAAVNKLGSDCRELIVVLFLGESRDYKEVASILGRPVGSIGPTRARCLEKLRALLEAEPLYHSGGGGL